MSKTDRIEREAKFQLSSHQQTTAIVENLTAADFSVLPLGTTQHTDTYLDTPSYTLLRHGLTLRVRHNSAAYEVGIKALFGTRQGSSMARLDIAFPLTIDADPQDAATWPATIFDELATMVAVKPKELRPLVVLHQTRAKTHIQSAAHNGTAAWGAELSEDEVWIGQHSDAADKSRPLGFSVDGEPTHFRELEIELLPAPTAVDAPNGATGQAEATTHYAAFDQWVADIQAQFKLSPIYESKFVRGLLHSVAQTHQGLHAITPTMSLFDAGRLLLHQQLLQILLNEDGVRVGKRAHYVHDMRVATRRARAALRLCATVVPAKLLKPYAKGLRQLGRALGAVRDFDVALANLRTFARNQPQETRRGGKRLRAELKTRRAHARIALLSLLDSKRHRKFIAELNHFCTTSHEGPSQHEDSIVPSQVRHTLPGLIYTAFEAVRAYEVAFEQDEVPALSIFHAIRIEAKYLRYLVEFSQHLMGRDGTLLANQLRDLQEHLGELNDAHVELLRLVAWSAQLDGKNSASDSNELRAALTNRHAELTARIATLVQKTPFLDFVAPPNRRRLGRALAAI